MNKVIKLFTILTLFLGFQCAGFCDSGALSGKVKTDAQKIQRNQVVDSFDGRPIDGASVHIPEFGFKTNTDKDGGFDIDTKVNKKAIMSVEKDGYRPFSITIDETSTKKPMKLGISQSQTGDITLETSVCHLGDDIYSENSANAGQFRLKSVGPFYTNRFMFERPKTNEQAVLIVGSIMGLDTKLAKELGQNKIANVYASPAEIYLNGQKIGELHINGDNQEITVPTQLVGDSTNEITIRTGRNLFQHDRIDYDDMEFANLRVEVRSKNIMADTGLK